MKDPSQNIGLVLKEVRFKRGLTLDEASKLTGVSKAMLGQIERGESVPTISTLWKISTGLKLSFSEFLSSKKQDSEVIDINALEAMFESDGKMILYNVFPFNPFLGFEYFYIKLLPGAYHQASPRNSSCEEYITVTKGVLKLIVDENQYILKAPSAISFRGDKVHIYSNPYEEEVIFQNIIKY